MKRKLLSVYLWAGFTLPLLLPTMLFAQTSNVGVGLQLGAPSGISVKARIGEVRLYDFTAAWDLGHFFFLQAHSLVIEAPLSTQDLSLLNYFMGPGALVGFRNRTPNESDIVVGISGNFGLAYYIQDFELFFQLTPRLEVIPATRGNIGGGIGFRYYIH